jgi:hypothetical protein
MADNKYSPQNLIMYHKINLIFLSLMFLPFNISKIIKIYILLTQIIKLLIEYNHI